ncbi:hypothetical protein [Streptomyces sp. NPDC002463]|uniref:hypothetical protein n=1 Tax=Streptomyces sp. NPDC002463 TaxID=3364645 RepID=UPI0036AD2A19
MIFLPVGPWVHAGTTAPRPRLRIARCGASVVAGDSHAERYLLHATQPLSGERWWAFATNADTGNPGTLKVFAICAKVVSTPALTAPVSG